MSMGDFGFDSANLLDGPENGIYWAVCLLIVVITNIIFLNFIITKASTFYEKNQKLHQEPQTVHS